MPTWLPPRVSRARLRPAAAKSSASSHEASRSLPFSRTSGVVSRGRLMAPKATSRGLEPLAVAVEVELTLAHEGGEGQVQALGEIDGQRARGRDAGDGGEPRHGGLLHELEAGAPAD